MKIDNKPLQKQRKFIMGLPSADSLHRLLLKIFFFAIIKGVSLAMAADGMIFRPF
jgi:hypothetical protein